MEPSGYTDRRDLEHREKGTCSTPSSERHEAKYSAAAQSLWMLGRSEREMASVRKHFGEDGQGEPCLQDKPARHADHCEGLGFDTDLNRLGGAGRNSELERVKTRKSVPRR